MLRLSSAPGRVRYWKRNQECEYKKPAANSTLDEVIETFELKYSRVVPGTEISESMWNIEDLLQPFPITPCLSSNFLSFYHAL